MLHKTTIYSFDTNSCSHVTLSNIQNSPDYRNRCVCVRRDILHMLCHKLRLDAVDCSLFRLFREMKGLLLFSSDWNADSGVFVLFFVEF